MLCCLGFDDTSSHQLHTYFGIRLKQIGDGTKENFDKAMVHMLYNKAESLTSRVQGDGCFFQTAFDEKQDETRTGIRDF